MTSLYSFNYGDIRPGIYERIIRAKDGRLVRVHFVVSENGGRLKGQIISVEPVEVSVEAAATQSRQPQQSQIFLPGATLEKNTAVKTVRKIPATSHASPYSFFDFFMSQPTRAPSLA